MIIAVDFDRTIHDFANPKPGRRMGPPIDRAEGALKWMRRHRHEIIIHSCNRENVIRDWMDYYGLPYDSIWTAKPYANIYIDDKGYRFTQWDDPQLHNTIEAFGQ